ncbi:hypothetical protein [Vulcanisaeta distributa]|uniref:hypothetical protein n=1 Tax=Vulcanisaeta distributa TaxID=164451 RepID=UPI001FB24656|nr:hypothetical protein [Vulcanisaeta distributa]
MIDRLNAIIVGLRNAVALTVEKLLEKLREANIEIPSESTIGDWGMERGLQGLGGRDNKPKRC